MENTFAKIAIVGSGAIGCYYGALLARSGADVHFLLRSDLDHVRAHGLHVQTPAETFTLPRVPCAATTAEIGPCDLVIVALKTTANAALHELLTPLLHARTAILTLQNGLGSDELLASLFGPERILGGLCFIGINRTAPGTVVCFERGSIALAEFGRPAGERAHAIAALFTRAGVRCQTGDDLARLRWKKLVWNIPFNGLAIAAGGISTDKILASPALTALVRTLMHEVIAAAARLGHEIPLTFIDQQLAQTQPLGAYKPSSLVDYLAGREVEVATIWGEPLRRAQAARADVPRLEMLHALLVQLTQSK